MKKSVLLGFAGILFVSASANAISINGPAGEDYTTVGFGRGTETTGRAASGNWMHNDDDGDVAGLGLGLNIPLGPLWRPLVVKVFIPIQTMAMKVMLRLSVVVYSGRSATAFVCLVSTITLLIRFPAVSTAMKKQMLVHV